jgi:hypothetical protein
LAANLPKAPYFLAKDMKKNTACHALVASALLLALQAHAQTMYRCGSVYQDRPCDAGKTGRALGSTGTAPAAAATASLDPECAQRGKDALKIVWSREGGATEERLVSEATTPAAKRLVQDVYRRRGAASHVQAAVEADCIAEKQKAEEDTAKAIAAALKAQREGTPQAPETAAAPSPDPHAEERAKRERAAYEADRKKEQCARYNARVDELRARERAGGSAHTMDELNEQRRSLRAQMSGAGC